MSVTVKIPTPLRKLTNGETSVDVDGATINAIVESLETSFPGMRERLIDESGGLRHFVNIYLNGEDVRYLDGLNSAEVGQDEGWVVLELEGNLEEIGRGLEWEAGQGVGVSSIDGDILAG